MSKLTFNALKFAKKAHHGQKRKSGEPYVKHPIRTAQIIKKEWGLKDEVLIAASYLHDTIEDCDSVNLQILTEKFGEEVALIVDGATKLKKTALNANTDSETQKKIVLKTHLDPRVALVKLADRLDNMRTLDSLPLEKQKYKSLETLKVYVPLAWSLGIWEVKRELEDLSFQYLGENAPEDYLEIKNQIKKDPRNSKAFINFWISNLKSIMQEEQIKGDIDIRKNSYWALIKKRGKEARLGKSTTQSFFDINDLISIRIQTNTIEDCYKLLGKIHNEQNIKNLIDHSRFDEFIGDARDNGYRAIQITLRTPKGALEVAIATQEMEDFNRFGVISLMIKGEKDLSEYLLKLIFTKDDDLIFLPREATLLDASYQINPAMGARAKKGIIDNETYSLSTVIPNGSKIEIITENEITNKKNLINYVLPKTKRLIEDETRREQIKKIINKGEIYTQQIVNDFGFYNLDDFLEIFPKLKTDLLLEFGCKNISDFYLKIAMDNQKKNQFQKWINKKNIKNSNIHTIIIKGEDKPGILSEITSEIKKMGGNILGVNLRSLDKKYKLRLIVEGIKNKKNINPNWKIY